MLLISQERREINVETKSEIKKKWVETDDIHHLINYYTEVYMVIKLDDKMESHLFRMKVVIYNGKVPQLNGRITHISMNPIDIYSSSIPNKLLPPPFYCFSSNFTGEPNDGELETKVEGKYKMLWADNLNGKLLIVKKVDENSYIPYQFIREGKLDRTYETYSYPKK